MNGQPPRTHGAARRAIALLVLLGAAAARSAGLSDEAWTLGEKALAALERGDILTEADYDPERGARARAAVRIAAPAAVVFEVMTSCAEALRYAPRLRRCAVLESAADGSWQLIEHEVDYGWYLPAMRYVFRAEYIPGRQVRFRHVSGDLREHEGIWQLAPAAGGRATIVTYRVRIVPAFPVPRWLLRVSLRRDLPAMFGALRQRCAPGRQSIAPESVGGLHGAPATRQDGRITDAATNATEGTST